MAVKTAQKKGKRVVAVSGGFDPVHVGHVRMFEAAKKLGDELVVILNNDHWLRKKKSHVFMPQHERKEVIEAFGCVDRVVITGHGADTADMSVVRELQKLKPDVFANGGDRFAKNIPEVAACKTMGCKMVFGVGQGGKVQSSSWLLTNYLKNKISLA
jgi:D-beta-D-heptose 7-phosphate kinase/D-beta-D-heptose 1-phosphate adenosyltransferase